MNKKFFGLIVLLAIIPACVKKRTNIIDSSKPYNINGDQPGVVRSDVADEDIDAFVLEEDNNPFNSNAIKSDEEENLTLANTESAAPGDLYDDSSKYGLKAIFYDFDQYAIRQDQQSVLEHNLKIVKDLIDQGHKVAIEGHACDSAGSEHYNMMLSEDRAKGVVDYFVNNGVSKEALSSVGWGSKKRIVPFGNREQQAPNRRVEIYAYMPKTTDPIA